MARPKENEDLEKVTFRLYKGDCLRLAQAYPDLGPNRATRLILRAHLNKIESRTVLPGVDIDIDLEDVA